MTQLNGYRVNFDRSGENSEYFGSISVESGTGSLNSTHHRFNVTGNSEQAYTEANAYPIGIERPENAGPAPLDVWQAALEAFHGLEKGEDY